MPADLLLTLELVNAAGRATVRGMVEDFQKLGKGITAQP